MCTPNCMDVGNSLKLVVVYLLFVCFSYDDCEFGVYNEKLVWFSYVDWKSGMVPPNAMVWSSDEWRFPCDNSENNVTIMDSMGF